ncbi:MAG: hypothetical protein HY862_17980 [Chloroflexi bacterium]|nr:hypothetical protein [Chloroflexota bacterium]
MLSRRLILLLLLFSLSESAFSPLHPAKPVHANHSVAYTSLEIIAEVNTHRMSLGINPLALNATLSKMAEDQAHYIQSLDFHPENYDFHKDAHGEYPRQRALRYKWPTFGPDHKQIEVGENAGLGSVQFIMDYWRKSELHRTAMENPAYREVGVGVVPHEYGFLIILVFGARPDIFPPLFDPERCELFTANERHTSGGGNWVHSVQTVQLTTSDGAPLTQPQAWQLQMLLPPTTGYQFSMVLDGDSQELIEHIDLASPDNIVIIPNTLPMLEKGEITTLCVSDPVRVVNVPTSTETPITVPTTPTVATTVPTSTQSSTVVTTPTQPPTVVAVAPPATQTPAPAIISSTEVKPTTVGNPAGVSPTTPEVFATVNVNRGSNLQCRQYPSSSAFSLGLISNGSPLTILGLPGARDERRGFPDGIVIEIPDYAAARLGEGIEINELWLNVLWQMPEGTQLTCWVNAFYVSTSYQGRSINSVASYLDLVQRDKLDFIPYNVPGGAPNQ